MKKRATGMWNSVYLVCVLLETERRVKKEWERSNGLSDKS